MTKAQIKIKEARLKEREKERNELYAQLMLIEKSLLDGNIYKEEELFGYLVQVLQEKIYFVKNATMI